MSEQEIDLGIGSLPLSELDMDLPSVRSFVDGELVNLDPLPISTAEQAQLQTCLADFGLSVLTVDEYMEIGTEALNNSLMQACKAGAAFWAAQETIKNTSAPGALVTFQQFIESNGLIKERVYECIRLAKYYARLPESQRNKVIKLGKKQALLLTKNAAGGYRPSIRKRYGLAGRGGNDDLRPTPRSAQARTAKKPTKGCRNRKP